MKTTIEVDLKWYCLDQNNSGGYFIRNETVQEHVLIQAVSPEDAENRANYIVEGYSSYCECCGERWSVWFTERDGTDEPCICGKPLDEVEAVWHRKNAVLHYFDGTKSFYKFGTGFVPYEQLENDE